MQTLYSVEIGKHDPASALEESLTGSDRSDDRAFVRDLVLGTLEHADESDAAIAPLLQGWTLDRLPVLDRIVLRMSVYELNFHKETPPAVVINEAVELAKKFSTDDSGKFVNGVLASATQWARESGPGGDRGAEPPRNWARESGPGGDRGAKPPRSQ